MVSKVKQQWWLSQVNLQLWANKISLFFQGNYNTSLPAVVSQSNFSIFFQSSINTSYSAPETVEEKGEPVIACGAE